MRAQRDDAAVESALLALTMWSQGEAEFDEPVPLKPPETGDAGRNQ